MKTVVFDIDGTLSLVGDRVECLKESPPNWDEFYARCGEDLPNDPALFVLRALLDQGDCDIVLLTGRRESVRPQTVEWLCLQGVFRYRLLMRPDGDHRHDTIVKPELLTRHNIKPDLVFEDRDSMAAYWRESGVPCFQVANGNF